MNIDVHIERLILDGLPMSQTQGPIVQAAVETELSRLLAERGLAANLQSGSALPSVRVEAIPPINGIAPGQVGQQIARAVYGGIGK